MDGQAEQAPESDGLAGLAGFLSDKPEKESEDDEPLNTESAPEEDNAEEENDELDDDSGDEPEEEPTPVEKVTIKVKNDEGQDETLELTTDEIANGYMRQAAFTKKTQALAAREDQAVKFLQSKHEEIRNQYMEQAAFARSAVEQMAGFRSESEMAQLAQNDPAAWVAENQRQTQIKAFLGSLDHKIKQEREQAGSQAQQWQQAQYQKAIETSWQELAKEKIDRPALVKIYEATSKNFGYSMEELANVTDHRLVKVLRDAVAYRELKAKAPDVTRKANAAPRMPTARQATPAQERKNQALNERFKSGRAKLNDLAALLHG